MAEVERRVIADPHHPIMAGKQCVALVPCTLACPDDHFWSYPPAEPDREWAPPVPGR